MGDRSAAAKKAWLSRRRGQKLTAARGMKTTFRSFPKALSAKRLNAKINDIAFAAYKRGKGKRILGGAIGGSHIGAQPGSKERRAAFKRLVQHATKLRKQGWMGSLSD